MVCCLVAAAIPWFFLTYGAAVQFYIGSHCPNLLRDSDPGGWLMVVSVAAFVLSYTRLRYATISANAPRPKSA